jgi:hypothetical protein
MESTMEGCILLEEDHCGDHTSGLRSKAQETAKAPDVFNWVWSFRRENIRGSVLPILIENSGKLWAIGSENENKLPDLRRGLV